MDSSSKCRSWTPILLEVAEKVRSRVSQILKKRASYMTSTLKLLLDSKAQEAVVNTLECSDASVHLISEEGNVTIGKGGMYVIADPVDGTTNLSRNIPLAVTSLAVAETPRLSDAVAGLVMDLYTGDVYRAERNRGAWHGREHIYPAEKKPLFDALISIDIRRGAPLNPVKGIIAKARHLRQLGCSALSLCLVTAGVIDAHIDQRGTLRATDVAAGLLILREAGGIYRIDGAVGGDMELSRNTTLNLIAAYGEGLLEDIVGLLDQTRA